jgi:hypothetical protein
MIRQAPTADGGKRPGKTVEDLIQRARTRIVTRNGTFQWQTKPFVCAIHPAKQTPILNLYSEKAGTFRPDDHRLMVWSVIIWHVSNLIAPNDEPPMSRRKGLVISSSK